MAKIAVVQFRSSIDKNSNLKKILKYIQDSATKGAKLCAFPEFMMFYTPSSQSPNELYNLAEEINGEFVSKISESARKNLIKVVGTIYERSPRQNRVYDTSFLIDEKGKIRSKYQKIHLYDALGMKESKKLFPGSKIAKPIKTNLGIIGMMICYDLRFPEMSRSLVTRGTEVLIVPSAWVKGEMKEDHWITINKTRAIENGCFVIAPDQIGNIYCGHSLVIDPFGRILLDLKKKQGVGFADISLDTLNKTRKKLPLLKNRRTDLYPDFKQ